VGADPEPARDRADPQMEATGTSCRVTDLEGNERKLVASPVQFDERPPAITGHPSFARADPMKSCSSWVTRGTTSSR